MIVFELGSSKKNQLFVEIGSSGDVAIRKKPISWLSPIGCGNAILPAIISLPFITSTCDTVSVSIQINALSPIE